MRLLSKLEVEPRRLALLPGSYNPPTAAHLGLANAALAHGADAVLLVLPRRFPHKTYEGATRRQRLAMLRQLANPRIAVAVSEGGLFVEMAAEARVRFPGASVSVVCGRDAAERIIGWDYGDPTAVERMLREFELLVAGRCGPFEPPERLAGAIRLLPMENYDECSATRVREAIRTGAPWRHLVPAELEDAVAEVFRGDCV